MATSHVQSTWAKTYPKGREQCDLECYALTELNSIVIVATNKASLFGTSFEIVTCFLLEIYKYKLYIGNGECTVNALFWNTRLKQII